jgi:hypothetical protein
VGHGFWVWFWLNSGLVMAGDYWFGLLLGLMMICHDLGRIDVISFDILIRFE